MKINADVLFVWGKWTQFGGKTSFTINRSGDDHYKIKGNFSFCNYCKHR